MNNIQNNPNLMIPNVQGAPGGQPLTRNNPGSSPTESGPDFKDILKTQTEGAAAPKEAGLSVESKAQQVRPGLKFSSHAQTRMMSRKIDGSPEAMNKVLNAVDRAEAKGLDDTLILTKDAAFIVSVKNRTVVTVMDKEQLQGNVFTNIDGAVIAES